MTVDPHELGMCSKSPAWHRYSYCCLSLRVRPHKVDHLSTPDIITHVQKKHQAFPGLV